MPFTNTRNGVCPSYYTYHERLDHIGGSLLFRFPVKILDALKYFGLYMFAHRMGTDPLIRS